MDSPKNKNQKPDEYGVRSDSSPLLH